MKIIKVARYLFMFTKYFGIMRLRFFLEVKRTKSIPLAPSIFNVETQRIGSISIFTACDSNYFLKYAPSFVGSFSCYTRDSPIHIHIYNPNHSALTLAHKLEQNYSKFSWSYDETDLSRLRRTDEAIYYCSARFVRFYEFMRRTRNPSLCLDVDSLCNRSTEALMEQLEEMDLAFHARFHKIGHNTKLLAGTLFIGMSNSGLSFAKNISDKLSYMIERGYFVDKVDQVIIYECYKELKSYDTVIRFQHLGFPFIDTEFCDNSVIWYPKGSTKNKEKYMSSLDRYSLSNI